MSVEYVMLPPLLAFFLGLVYGRNISIKGVVLPPILLIGLLASWLIGPYLFYTSIYSGLPFSLSETYLAALVGLVIAANKEREGK